MSLIKRENVKVIDYENRACQKKQNKLPGVKHRVNVKHRCYE